MNNLGRKSKIVALLTVIVFGLQCLPLTAWGLGLSGTLSGLGNMLNNEKVRQKIQEQSLQRELKAPSSVWTQNVQENSLAVYWSKAENNQGAVTYALYQDGKYVASTNKTNYPVKGLSKGTEYRFFVIASDKGAQVSKQSKTISVRTKGFKNEADKKAYYSGKVEAKNELISKANQQVDAGFNRLISSKIDAAITPQTNSAVKFSLGVLEGVPKGLKDLSMFGLSIAESALPENVHASTMNSYLKYKDGEYDYIINHPVQTASVAANALYKGGKAYLQEVTNDSRKLGNLVGETAALAGTAKVAVSGVKGVSATSKAVSLAKVNKKAATAEKIIDRESYLSKLSSGYSSWTKSLNPTERFHLEELASGRYYILNRELRDGTFDFENVFRRMPVYGLDQALDKAKTPFSMSAYVGTEYSVKEYLGSFSAQTVEQLKKKLIGVKEVDQGYGRYATHPEKINNIFQVSTQVNVPQGIKAGYFDDKLLFARGQKTKIIDIEFDEIQNKLTIIKEMQLPKMQAIKNKVNSLLEK